MAEPEEQNAATKLALLLNRGTQNAVLVLQEMGVDVSGDDIVEALAAVTGAMLSRHPNARFLAARRALRERFAERLKDHLNTAMLETERAEQVRPPSR